MIRFFFIAACFILWANSANAGCAVPCTQNQLLTEINTNWADNTTGNITPALLRAPVSDIVNTYFSLLSQYQLPVNTIAVGKGVGVNGLNSATVTAPLVLSGSTLSCPTCGTGGSGTVTSASVVTANGFAGSVATATTTPAITLNTTVTGITKGNGTALSAAVAGTDYQSPISLTTTGTSGAATFIGNTLNIPQYSGGGTPGGSSGQIQYNNSGAFGGFTLSGDATANTSTGALTLATVNANVGSFGSSTQCTAFTTNAKGLITAASQTTCTPAIANITGLGTGVSTALAVNVGSAGSFVTNGGALGTPASATLTNATGLPLSGLNAQAAWSFVVNNTSGSAAPTAVDIGSLTSKASPAATDLVIISDQAASGALKRATVSSISSGGSVASVNGQTGAITLPVLPQGRLTLQTATPVMTTTQSAKTTIYYTAYQGNQVPIYDGTNFVSTPITGGEISVATTDTTKSPAAIGASKVNDWFVWNDSGTIRIGHGPDWTSDTARSAGTALVMVNGILLNNASITNGPAASRGTYVGTTRSNGSSQLDWIYGGPSAGGTAGFFGVWNMYNRTMVGTTVIDTSAGWSMTSTTPRSVNASNGNRVTFISGLAEESIFASYTNMFGSMNAGGGVGRVGFALDATASFDFQGYAVTNSSGIQVGQHPSGTYVPQLGVHFIQAVECSDGSAGGTNFSTGAGSGSAGGQQGLKVMLRM